MHSLKSFIVFCVGFFFQNSIIFAQSLYDLPSTFAPKEVSRITVYRVNAGPEIARLKANGYYQTSLIGSDFTKLCFINASEVALSVHVVDSQALAASSDDVKVRVPLKAGKDVIVRMTSSAKDRIVLDVVSPEVAKLDFKSARLQMHARSRVPNQVPCPPDDPPYENVMWVSDVVLDFNKLEADIVSASDRTALDRLIERMAKQDRSFEKARIEVIGDAQALGAEAGDVSLFQRRTASIKKYMRQQGLTKEMIAAEGRLADLGPMVSDCNRETTPKHTICKDLDGYVVVRASIPIVVKNPNFYLY